MDDNDMDWIEQTKSFVAQGSRTHTITMSVLVWISFRPPVILNDCNDKERVAP